MAEAILSSATSSSGGGFGSPVLLASVDKPFGSTSFTDNFNLPEEAGIYSGTIFNTSYLAILVVIHAVSNIDIGSDGYFRLSAYFGYESGGKDQVGTTLFSQSDGYEPNDRYGLLRGSKNVVIPAGGFVNLKCYYGRAHVKASIYGIPFSFL